MAAKLHSYRTVLRHPEGVTHTQTLDAPSREEAIRLTRDEAVAMGGGAPEAWEVSSCELQGAPVVRRAA